VNSEANSRRITNVEKCFGASGQPLAVTGRVLVGEGVLTKLCRKKPKPRQVSVKIFHCRLLSHFKVLEIIDLKYVCCSFIFSMIFWFMATLLSTRKR
jgi:hypothetical protein